ncbi:hypothetical protein [Gordonia shandongensis]|uniref:hypothetical protein n=1 Tax=Gordonia shandongensis TaxID=376351 RepID=UPI00040528F7|nr:hypothetical protein [Gordonia shandongensis]
MRITRRIAAAGAALAVAASAVVGASAPAEAAPAEGTPVHVDMMNPTAMWIGFMMIPNGVGVGMQAKRVGPGAVELRADMTEDTCRTAGGHARLNVSYLNVNTGRSGSASMLACELDPVPDSAMRATIRPGAGRVILSVGLSEVNVTQPGTLYLPGAATFRVG